ncbi:TIGR03086 family metal-binding protein [Propionibacteriaceae bacterium Y2011]
MLELRPATTTVADLVRGVADDDLDRPTPCPEMPVRGLLGHLHGLSVAFADAARKVDGPTTSTPPDPSRLHLPDDWRTTIPEALAALAEAWAAADAWTGMTQAGGQQMPGEVAGMVALDEVALHGWDLAVATGQAYHVDADTAAAVEQFCDGIGADPAERNGLFGARVPVAGDAPLWDRALGLSGRDPAWQSP